MRSLLSQLLLTAIFVSAGLPVDAASSGITVWTPSEPIAISREVKAIGAGDKAARACGACKTTMVYDLKQVGPGKGHTEWIAIGSKHACANCGGTITVVKRKTTDSMKYNCTMCGEDAAFFSALPSANKEETK